VGDPRLGEIEEDSVPSSILADLPDELHLGSAGARGSSDRNGRAGGARVRGSVDPVRIANDNHAPKRNRDAGGASGG
jgi:hypothetical protein